MKYKPLILPGCLILLTVMMYFYQPIKKGHAPPISSLSTDTVSANEYVPFAYEKIIDGEKKLQTEMLLIKSLRVKADPFSGKFLSLNKNTKSGSLEITDNSISNKKEIKKITAKPIVTFTKTKLTLNLEGIWISNNQRIAIIDGHTLKTNEAIDGFRITSISEKKVHLEKDGHEYILHLEQ